jgi:serine/threonine protein kinase
MPVKIEPHAEPIPGYRLIERLGGGGFGEVWKAEAPGGLLKAIKFVYGDLGAIDDADGSRAGQELKALSRVKTVRHAYILSIERFDIIDGQLIIITELADRTLWDRFRECRTNGLPGVPREELLRYMEETAEALDFMNEQFQLQHLDIKPQNLFLVHNHIKVADFGLAKDMGDKAAATITGGVTPVYAAPETFDGWLSRYSDQYSLAIVYQEILTGQRPFTGSTMRQLVLQHLQTAPELSSLPGGDRPVIARALHKNPDERYPTCIEFVKGLKDAGANAAARTASGGAPNLVPATTPQIPAPATPPSISAAFASLSDGQVTQGAPGAKSALRADTEPENKGPSLENRPQLLPARPEGPRTPLASGVSETPGDAGGRTIPATPFAARGNGATARARHDLDDEPGTGILQPALIVGLGKLGLETLRRVRKLVAQEFGHADALPQMRLLGIDTDPDSIQAAGNGDPEGLLRGSQVLLAKLHRPSHYLKAREGQPATDGWLNSKVLYRVPRQQVGASLRPLGRLAFVDNFRSIARRLERELECCVNPRPNGEAEDAVAEDALAEDALGQDGNAAAGEGGRDSALRISAELGLRSKVPRVYIVACLGGATGSGMFIDAAYVARHLLRKQGFPNAEVVGVLLAPPSAKDTRRLPPAVATVMAHTYAALTELNYYSSGQMFSARYDASDRSAGNRPFTEAGPPFQRCVLLNLPPHGPSNDEPTEATRQAAELVFRELATPLGAALDAARKPHQQTFHTVGRAAYQTFGMQRLLWPRRQLLKQSARNLCNRLIERWMSKDARDISDEVRNWSLEQWEAVGLRPENLITSHQEKCEKVLNQAPERLFQEIISPLTEALSKGNGRVPATGELNLGPLLQAMDQLERLLGLPDDCRPPGPQASEPGAIESALAEASKSVGADCEQKLLQTIVQLIEQPCYRLAGAEEALRQFSAIVEQALKMQEPLAKEVQDNSVLLYQRIQVLLETPMVLEESRTTSLWKFGRRKDSAGDDLIALLKSFAKARYQSLILFYVNRLYLSLRGIVSDQIREVDFCRARLGELAGLVTAARHPDAEAAGDQHLLPEGCGKVADAIRAIDLQIGAEELAAFDQRVQDLVRRDYRALVNVCTGSSQVVRNLAPAMLAEAESFLEPFLQGRSVAELFIQQKGGADRDPRKELQAVYNEAAPKIVPASSSKEICVVVVPNDEAGTELQDAVGDVLRAAKIVEAPRKDEIIFYREQLQLLASDLEQLGPVAQEAYRRREAQDPGTLHCREDITDWHTGFAPRSAPIPSAPARPAVAQHG